MGIRYCPRNLPTIIPLGLKPCLRGILAATTNFQSLALCRLLGQTSLDTLDKPVESFHSAMTRGPWAVCLAYIARPWGGRWRNPLIILEVVLKVDHERVGWGT